MSSKIADRQFRTAAWRISFWGAIAFALGTAVAFGFLQQFLANDLQRRADAWLVGELGVLADVAEHTPHGQLYDAVIREVAELASREVPRDAEGTLARDRTVFFLMTDGSGHPLLFSGAGSAESSSSSILHSKVSSRSPSDVTLEGFEVPFRVAQMDMADHQRIYLGLSTQYERSVLRRLRLQFLALWCMMIFFGGMIVFLTTRRMLQRVLEVSDTAAQIGRDNLLTRVPVSSRNDEISQLSVTFNGMLNRIQAAVQQLHTMTDAIAHDLRSPITAIRGQLELALTSGDSQEKDDVIVSTIEELDQLTGLLNTSLDVSEASAKALRLRKESLDLSSMVHTLVDLYDPAFAEAGIQVRLEGKSPVFAHADGSLMQRTLTNLFENEVKHLPSASQVKVSVLERAGQCVFQMEDNGPGFPEDLLPTVFEPYVRGEHSHGHGLGLAFAAAVVRAHGGNIAASNRSEGGARIVIELPST